MNIRLRTFLVAFTAACLWYNGSVVSAYTPQAHQLHQLLCTTGFASNTPGKYVEPILDCLVKTIFNIKDAGKEIIKGINAISVSSKIKTLLPENLAPKIPTPDQEIVKGSFTKVKESGAALCSGIWNKATYLPKTAWDGCVKHLGPLGTKLFVGYLITGYLYAYTVRKSQATNIFNRRTPADQKGRIDNVQGGNLVINLRDGGNVTLDTLFFPMVAWANMWEAAGNNRMFFVGP